MSISHQDVLDTLLSANCPSFIDEETEIYEFHIELHCVAYTIKAKSLGWDEEKSVGRYEILEFKLVNGIVYEED